MHLLVRDRQVLEPAVSISRDDHGARQLAELYRFPVDQVRVRAMMNATLDGAVAGEDGTSGSIHCAEDSFVFGVLRALCDVLLVGAHTVRVEDYRRPTGRRAVRELSWRPTGSELPALAIMTRTGDLPPSLGWDWPTYLIVPSAEVSAVRHRTGAPAEQVLAADTPQQAIRALIDRGYRGIQCEGGPSLLGRLAAAQVLDELCLTTTHRTVSGSGSRLMTGEHHSASWELTSLIVGAEASIARYQCSGAGKADENR
ncbi:dihydrofolate reductase family protein [Devriesea agamarum]|uniref:dihydrofolate reductase family protein n=1 Tax=Devriesea agamarum TaxID=472569 RepID=UPI00071D7922|nr:dihydrofolate reductase family protein [Devriesea agamarum]